MLIGLLIVSINTTCFAGWLIYHKPAYNGRILDTESKKSIEGAVVVAIYYKYPIISGPGGGSPSIVGIKKALTDEKGEFHIPSYTTFIQPNSIEDDTDFIFYKPGYGGRISPSHVVNAEKLFTKKIDVKGEIRVRGKTIYFTYGVVELPGLETRKQRLRSKSGWEVTEMRKGGCFIF